jgi:hypothetical protein
VAVAGEALIINKAVPAGHYVVTAHVGVTDPGNDNGGEGTCDLAGVDQGHVFFSDHSWSTNMTLTAAVTVGSGPLQLTCTEREGNFDVASANLTAIRVDSIG